MSEENGKSNLSTAKLDEEIDVKGPTEDGTAEDTVVESRKNENVSTENAQENEPEGNDQVSDKAAEETANASDVKHLRKQIFSGLLVTDVC